MPWKAANNRRTCTVRSSFRFLDHILTGKGLMLNQLRLCQGLRKSKYNRQAVKMDIP